jgi:hypothetical protein
MIQEGKCKKVVPFSLVLYPSLYHMQLRHYFGA